MTRPDFLFVYGTLRPDISAHLPAGLEPEGQAMTRGHLFALHDPGGSYPLAVHGSGRIAGWLLQLPRTGALPILRRLDRYEGRNYARRRLIVRRADGGRVMAQAYVWRGAAPKGAERIASGDFADWMAVRRFADGAEGIACISRGLR